MITTIIFDLSNVYLEGILGSHRYFEKKLGTSVPDEYFYNEEFNKFMLGQITEDVYWKAVIENNSWDISAEDLKKAARKNFTEIKGTRQIIERLKKEGYILILLSNNGKEWAEYCEKKYSYHKLFNHVIYSYQVNISKPNKKIFSLLLTKIDKKPEECLFIDDYTKNIQAANDLGISTIQFTTPKNLIIELQEKEIRSIDL